MLKSFCLLTAEQNTRTVQIVNSADTRSTLLKMSNVSSGDDSSDDMLRRDAVDVGSCSNDTDAFDNDTNKRKGSRTPWLYQCMISGCSDTFERLTDLRVHFVGSHQPGSLCLLC